MMGKKKLSDIKAQLEALAAHRPDKPSKSADAKRAANRIVETLESLCALLEHEAKKRKRPKARRRPAKR